MSLLLQINQWSYLLNAKAVMVELAFCSRNEKLGEINLYTTDKLYDDYGWYL